MRIAFVNQPTKALVPPVQAGGIEIWTYEVARRLARSHDVICLSKRTRALPRSEAYEGVEYRRVWRTFDRRMIRLLRRLSTFRDPAKPLLASGWSSFGYAYHVATEVRWSRCDIAHIHNHSQLAPVVRALNPRIMIVLHMHCEWLTQLDQTMIERRLGKVDLVIGCSEYITEKIRRRFPEFADRCQTVYNGVDTDRFAGRESYDRAEGAPTGRFLFVGRVSPEKGLHTLLDAFERVIDSCPDTCLEIVGPSREVSRDLLVALSDDEKVTGLASFYREGQGETYLMQLQSRLSGKLASRVTFTDSVPHAELVDRYHQADVYVQPSFSDAFPLPPLEAMACGVPVVASRVGGIPEAVANGQTGLLVEAGDAVALAEAMRRLIEDRSLRERMGRAARQRAVDLFSWEPITESLLLKYATFGPVPGYD